MKTTHPLIRLEPSGIKVLHLRPAQDDIRARYGPRYHVDDHCLRDIAALWGFEPDQEGKNGAGVFDPCELIHIRAGRCRAEMHYARSPSGLWAMATSYNTAVCGAGASPSVWNSIAFLSETDAERAGLAELTARFRGIAARGGPGAADARKMMELLDAERMPQLSLF